MGTLAFKKGEVGRVENMRDVEGSQQVSSKVPCGWQRVRLRTKVIRVDAAVQLAGKLWDRTQNHHNNAINNGGLAQLQQQDGSHPPCTPSTEKMKRNSTSSAVM
jgi:hypothetical protein